MMHWDAGVKNVVVGGRPSHGPMQTPSGSRAARFYPLFEMDGDFDGAAAIGPEEDHVGDIVIPDRLNQDIFISDGGISLRNQVREGETIPLQMQFEAADCRIFYTFRTFNNFTNLWKHAADAMWKNPDLCVQGSTGFAKSKESTPRPAPAAETLPGVKYSHIGVPDLHHTDEDVDMPLFDQPLPNAGPRAMRPVATINELELYKQYKLKQGETIQQRPTHKPVPKHRLTTQKPTTCARAGPNCLNKRKVRWGV